MLWRLFGLGCCAALLVLSAASAAALGGAVYPKLDVLAHFAPIYLAMGAGGLLLSPWLVGGWRFVAGGLSLIAISASAALMLPELSTIDRIPSASPGPSDLKIIQFNALASNRVKEGAAAWILRQEPDLVVLEEAGGLDRLIAAEGDYKRVQGSLSSVILAKAAPARGNYVFWSLPRLPSAATLATFSDRRGEYAVIGVHRPWPSDVDEVARQEAYLRRLVHSFGPETTIVAGDFNSTPWSFDRRREDRMMGLARRTRAMFSWPADQVSHNRFPLPLPLLPIDHVYAGSGWTTVSVERGPRLGSDHYPIVVVLRPNGAAGRLPAAHGDGDARLAALPYYSPVRH